MSKEDPAVEDGRNEPMMPLAWIRERQLAGDRVQRVFCTTMGASRDFLSRDLRRLLVQACYWGVGIEEHIPAAGVQAELSRDYQPSAFGFGGYRRDRRPADFLPAVDTTD